MLDLDPTRSPSPTRDAATLIVIRDAPEDLEVFCVERHPKSGFMGGAIVFPGGKVNPEDASASWEDVVHGGADPDRPLRIAACREALEEAALLPLFGVTLSHAALLSLRASVARKEQTIPGHLRERHLRLDLAALHPFARWITPVAESRRYDTRFYLTVLPAGQEGAHDDHETTSSFWASPAAVLARWGEGSVQLAPPTHRTLEILAKARTTAHAMAMAEGACLEPICPILVAQGDLLALVLPGDPAHDVREARVAGPSRFVLRDGRWRPEDAPAP